MKAHVKSTFVLIPVLAAALAAHVVPASATTTWATVTEIKQSPRDGRHDFDRYMGTWNIAHRRLKNPLHHSHAWYTFTGTMDLRPLWGGLANIDDNVLNYAQGNVRAITIRFYDTKMHLWSIYWATDKSGLGLPATVGAFDSNGIGHFYDHEVWHGTPIVCRYTWSPLTSTGFRWEQAFSTDEGKTWETNWTMNITRAG